MTSALARLGRAGSATLLVHGTRALLALGAAWPISKLALAEPSSIAAFMRLSASPSLAVALRDSALHGVVALLLAPALCTGWLRALVAPASLPDLTRFALARYGVAVRICLAWTSACLVVVAVSLAAAMLTHRAIAFAHDTRVQDLAALAATLPGLFALAWLATWRDTAHAALAAGASGALAALRVGREATTFRTVLLCVLSTLAAVLLTAIGLLTPRALLGASAQGDIAAFTLTQTTALAMTLSRGLWLATAVAQVTHRDGP